MNKVFKYVKEHGSFTPSYYDGHYDHLSFTHEDYLSTINDYMHNQIDVSKENRDAYVKTLNESGFVARMKKLGITKRSLMNAAKHFKVYLSLVTIGKDKFVIRETQMGEYVATIMTLKYYIASNPIESECLKRIRGYHA